MARPEAKNVDYFPCYCKDGKVLFILESRWGNNGYAFFYKLWKRLGDADHHYIDLRQSDNWEYFRAKMGVSDTETTDILNKLSEMGVIDPELWSNHIIWSDSFVESVKTAWTKRKQLIPQKPTFLIQKPAIPEKIETETTVSGDHNPQRKVNKRKPPISPKELESDFDIFYSAYPKHVGRKHALNAWKKLNGTRPPIDTLLRIIEVQKQTDEWRKENGKFIPHPASWLNAARWEDEVDPPKPKSVFS